MKTVLYQTEAIDEVANILKNGGIVAFPTDTVFGLGCVYDIKEAIEAIKKAKGRDEKKPLPMMCLPEMVETVAFVNNQQKKLMDRFMPGAMTQIFLKKDLPDYVTNGKDTVAIRLPDDPWIMELIRKCGKPLLVTSANLSDHGSLKRWEDVLKDLDGRIDGIVCADARGESASVIVSAIDELMVLRPGDISLKEIEEVLK